MFSSKLLAGSAIVLTAAALTIAAASPLSAQDAEEEDNGPGSGVLMLTARGAETATPAIQLGTDMNVTVSGTVARVRVTQAFRNTSTRWVEARYVYPLPQDGAVDSLKMVVGQRVIVGHVKPREVAEKIYEKAKDSGQRAGLVEEQRRTCSSTASPISARAKPSDRDRISGAGAPGCGRVLAASAFVRRPALHPAAHAELAEEDCRRKRRSRRRRSR